MSSPLFGRCGASASRICMKPRFLSANNSASLTIPCPAESQTMSRSRSSACSRPQQVVVLAVGAREERRRVLERNAFELLRPLDRLQRARIVDADAVDQQLVEFADLAPG